MCKQKPSSLDEKFKHTSITTQKKVLFFCILTLLHENKSICNNIFAQIFIINRADIDNNRFSYVTNHYNATIYLYTMHPLCISFSSN